MTEGYKGRIGLLIRDARKHRGLTQSQLADLLSTSQSAINRIESDVRSRIIAANTRLVIIKARCVGILAPDRSR